MLLATSFLLAATLIGAPAGGTLAITFEKAAVVAAGVTPGADVLWFSVSIEYPRWTPRVVRRERVDEDTDSDGRVEFDLIEGVPKNSIWAVVDLSNGNFAISRREGSAGAQGAFPGTVSRLSADGTVEAAELAQEEVEGLAVRPGKGAWAFTAGPTAASAMAKSSRPVVNLDLTASRSIVKGAGKFNGLTKGDVVIFVDPREMRFYAVRFEGVR